MWQINNNKFLVEGPTNGAIYDLTDNKVYALNRNGVKILLDYLIDNQHCINDEFVQHLYNSNIINPVYVKNEVKIPMLSWKLQMAWLEVTQSCNLRCLHCYEGDCHKNSGLSLSLSDWFRIIDELVDIGAKRLVIIGGEPACYSNIKEILEFVARKNIKVVFFTNGTLLDHEIINIISSKQIYVKMSIYGHNSGVHDAITRVPGSFSKTLSSVNKLLSSGVPVEASLIVMKENQKYLQEIIDFVRRIGMIYERYDVIRNIGGGKDISHNVDDPGILSKSYRTEPCFQINEDTFVRNMNYNSCWHGRIAITENGNTLPCVFAREYRFGNVKEFPIRDILNKAAEASKKFKVDNIEKCKSCEYRYACSDCRPIAISAGRSMFGKTQRCSYDPYKGIWQAQYKD